MKKLLLGIFLMFIISLTACEKQSGPYYLIKNPENVYSMKNDFYEDWNYYYNLLEHENKAVYFRVFRLYNKDQNSNIEGGQISSYAYQIITEKKLTLTFSCYNDTIYEIETIPNKKINLSEKLSDNLFTSVCQTRTIDVFLKENDVILFEDSFIFNRNLVPDNPDDFQFYNKDTFPLYNYIVIPLIGLVLVIFSCILYKKHYKKTINKSLTNGTPFRLPDFLMYVIFNLIICMLLVYGILYYRYTDYENQRYNNVHINYYSGVSNIKFEDLAIDFDHLELQEVRVLEADGKLITYSQYHNTYYIDIDFEMIRTDVLDVLQKDPNVSICGGVAPFSICVLDGPMPSIRLILNDGNSNIHLKIDNGYDAIIGRAVIYIEVYTDNGTFYYHYNSVMIEEQTERIYHIVEQAFYEYYANLE